MLSTRSSVYICLQPHFAYKVVCSLKNGFLTMPLHSNVLLYINAFLEEIDQLYLSGMRPLQNGSYKGHMLTHSVGEILTGMHVH